MDHPADVWTAATVVIFFAIGLDAILAARRMEGKSSARKLMLSFVAIFWLGALTEYVPALFDYWPEKLAELSHKILPVAALFFLVGGGFRKIVEDVSQKAGAPLPDWALEFVQKLNQSRDPEN